MAESLNDLKVALQEVAEAAAEVEEACAVTVPGSGGGVIFAPSAPQPTSWWDLVILGAKMAMDAAGEWLMDPDNRDAACYYTSAVGGSALIGLASPVLGVKQAVSLGVPVVGALYNNCVSDD